LLNGYEDKGHIVYTDNYYTSPNLFNELQKRNIGTCGTVKSGRYNMPRDLGPRVLHLQKGDDPVFQRCNNLVACAWHDTKRVHLLSTVNHNDTIEKVIRARGEPGGRRTVKKPVIEHEYNTYMSGVDLMDQRLGTYDWSHKSSKWYMTLYHRLLEMALVNGYIIHSCLHWRSQNSNDYSAHNDELDG
jgi:hypothetical protein